ESRTNTMRSFLKQILMVLLTTVAITTRGATIPPANAMYFRSDGGVARDPGTLPDDLNATGALSWRVPMDAGHSTPLLLNGHLYLTTWNAASNQLATVALDAETGKVLWRVPLAPE